jgi:Ca2+-binding EF-hand superfamily protein
MKLIMSTLTALAIGAAVATAAEGNKESVKPKQNPAASFKQLDTNADGKLSLDEFKTGNPRYKTDPSKAEPDFKAKDKNGDGFLSRTEFRASGQPKREKGEPGDAKKQPVRM